MSDRKYSDPMIYDNSIDSDDDPSGYDGGYDRHGNYINSAAMMELVGLRKELASLKEAVRIHLNLKDCSDIDQVQRSMDVIEKLMESNK